MHETIVIQWLLPNWPAVAGLHTWIRSDVDRRRESTSDAKGRIRDLEADVRYSQERAVRADQWMAQISSEIQHRLLAPAPLNHGCN
jgi:hypothetical protein